MARYTYKALDETGRKATGTVDAESMDRAGERLKAMGLMVEHLTEQSAVPSFSAAGIRAFMARARPEEVIIFSKQLGTMLKAGVPVIRCLDILERQSENEALKAAAKAIAVDIRNGSPLSDAFRKHPRLFSSLYCNLLHAGESSGSLPEILDRLIYIMQHENKIRSDIRSALQYPMLVLITLAAAFIILLAFVIPKFATMFVRANVILPLPTRVALTASNILFAHWPLIIAGGTMIIFALILAMRTSAGRYIRDSILVRIPVIGVLLIKAAVSRFSSVFSILHASGVPVLDAMRMLSGTIGNSVIARQLDMAVPMLKEGRGISAPLQTVKYFPPMLINMVAIGEESGNLDKMLREVSTHYDAEVEYAMKRLSDAVGPVLIVLLAAVVGFFALAIYMPIWDLSKVARSGSGF